MVIENGKNLSEEDAEKLKKWQNMPIPANDEDLVDKACDAENPITLSFEEATEAYKRIKDGIVYSSCNYSNHLSKRFDMELYLKKEFQQVTGSFKDRGARNSLLRLNEEQRKRGVIAASAGNHSQALAYHAGLLNIRVVVVMPTNAPQMKIHNCVNYGALVVIRGESIYEARKLALVIAKNEGLVYINGYDHIDILAGQGSVGFEILEQVGKMDAIVVPIGGAGLIAGVSVVVKNMYPSVSIIGVESAHCPSYRRAAEKDKPVYTPMSPTLADGLTVPLVGFNSFATAKNLVDELITVDEKYIPLAILRLLELEKSVVEGGGAVTVAAMLSGQLDHYKGKKVVAILSGGNIDSRMLGRCIETGLAMDDRLIRLQVVIRDNPAGLPQLTDIFRNLGVNVKDIVQKRVWLKHDIFEVKVTCVCETNSKEHTDKLLKSLREHYKEIKFFTYFHVK